MNVYEKKLIFILVALILMWLGIKIALLFAADILVAIGIL